MKKMLNLLLILCCALIMFGCDSNDSDENTPSDNKTEESELEKLDTPVVKLTASGVEWEAVENATSYVYKINDGAKIRTLSLSVQLSDGDTFVVKASGDKELFSDSDYSDVVTYVYSEVDNPTPVKLSTPVVTVSEEGVATWSAVEHASGYIYKINNGEEKETSTKFVQLADGDKIVVKAKGDEANYLDSDFSQSVTYTAPEVSYAYTAFDKNGNEIASSNSIWNAIANARESSKSSNKCYVIENETGNQVYKYSTTKFYCFRSDEYVASYTSETDAIAWGKQFENSYVINGTATECVYVGKKIETKYGLDKENVYGTELFSGSYAYFYGKDGAGYTYCQFKVEMSKVKYKYFTDDCNEIGWNSYVFCNMTMNSPWVSCDMGISNISTGTPGGFGGFFTYHSANHSAGMFSPSPKAGNVTELEYNETTGYWENGDDLLFTCWIENGAYNMRIENLNPNSECTNKDKDSPLYGGRVWEYTYEIPEAGYRPTSSKLLLAASYCPVQKSGTFWNPRCGNAFENVTFRNMKVARYGSYSSIEDYGYNHSSFHYILTVGADNCTATQGTDSDGAYFSISIKNYFH